MDRSGTKIASALGLALSLCVGQPGAVSPRPIEAGTAWGHRAAFGISYRADVLRSGGNAIGPAVTVAHALAVVLPCRGNIGGGGFATIDLASGKDIFVDVREGVWYGDRDHVSRRSG